MFSNFVLKTDEGSEVHVSYTVNGEQLVIEVSIAKKNELAELTLHWGIHTVKKPNCWFPPAENAEELKTFKSEPATQFREDAARTLFALENDRYKVKLYFGNITTEKLLNYVPVSIEFVLEATPKRWIKSNHNTNFLIPVGSQLLSLQTEKEIQKVTEQLLGSPYEKLETKYKNREIFQIQNENTWFSVYVYVLADNSDAFCVYFLTNTSHAVSLVWGLIVDEVKGWTRPPAHLLKVQLPEGKQCFGKQQFESRPFNTDAYETAFEFVPGAEKHSLQYVKLILNSTTTANAIEACIKEIYTDRWFKDGNKNFSINIPQNPDHLQKKKAFEDEKKIRHFEIKKLSEKKESIWDEILNIFSLLKAEYQAKASLSFKSVKLSDDIGFLYVILYPDESTSTLTVEFLCCAKCPLILHWGVHEFQQKDNIKRIRPWKCPPKQIWPPNTTVYDISQSCETPFQPFNEETLLKTYKFNKDQIDIGKEILQALTIIIPYTTIIPKSESDFQFRPLVEQIVFVLKDTYNERWFKSEQNLDITIRLTQPDGNAWSGEHADLAQEITEFEDITNHVTLMHRFNKMNEVMTRWEATTTPSPAFAYNNYWMSLFNLKGDDHTVNKSPDTINEKEELDKVTKLHYLSWVFVWSRLSYIRALDWQRNYNTPPRYLAHSTDVWTLTLSRMWLKYPEFREMFRLILSTVPRGGNNGQAIRDRILQIMHCHRIPERYMNFYEQWHQKLHNNTTPDDILISESVIKFLKSGGDVSVFWNTLQEQGLTKERLASYERPITTDPYVPSCDVEALIRDFESYQDILKDVHDALDLEKAVKFASPYLSAEDNSCLNGILGVAHVSGIHLMHGFDKLKALNLSNQEMINRFRQIAAGRRKVILRMLDKNLSPEAARALLFLDFALEQQQCITLQNSANLDLADSSEIIDTLLWSLCAQNPDNYKLHCVTADWKQFSKSCVEKKFSSSELENILMLKALVDRVVLYVSEMTASVENLLSSKVRYLKTELDIDEKIINVFVDEVLRSSIYFGISLTLKKMEARLRQLAKLPPWEIISYVDHVQGRIVQTNTIAEIQDRIFDEPTILVSGAVYGQEEVPIGVYGILIRSGEECPDVLSHISVRARNSHVLLAVCYDEEITKNLIQHEGKWSCIEIDSSSNNVKIQYKEQKDLRLTKKQSKAFAQHYDRKLVNSNSYEDIELCGKKTSVQMNLTVCSDSWIVKMKDFTSKTVGSKSLNLAQTRNILPTDLKVPISIALPFGCFAKILQSPENKKLEHVKELKKLFSTLTQKTLNAEAIQIFQHAQKVVLALKCPKAFEQEFESILTSDSDLSNLFQLYQKHGLEVMWTSICSVYASMFALRPWVGLSKAGLPYDKLNMAVLIQEVFPAKFAFVLHTRNPLNIKEVDEMYGELVIGLGETLVGNTMGRALSWTSKKGEESVQIVSFPSKAFSMHTEPSLIYRSDSNSEDLENFAGAGLFESVTAAKTQIRSIRYSSSCLLYDFEFRQKILNKISIAAFIIQDIFKKPMDIEGVILENNDIGIVQMRPQIL